MGIAHLNATLAQPELNSSGLSADHTPNLGERESRFVQKNCLINLSFGQWLGAPDHTFPIEYFANRSPAHIELRGKLGRILPVLISSDDPVDVLGFQPLESMKLNRVV